MIGLCVIYFKKATRSTMNSLQWERFGLPILFKKIYALLDSLPPCKLDVLLFPILIEFMAIKNLKTAIIPFNLVIIRPGIFLIFIYK